MTQHFRLFPRAIAIRMGETDPKKIARKLKQKKKRTKKSKKGGDHGHTAQNPPPKAA